MNAVYNRYEQKYILTKEARDTLIPLLETYLDYDTYSGPKKSYVVRNIYYDTDDYNVIRESIQKPVYKEKLRLRCYDDPVSDDDLVYLEIKKKFKGRVNKRRLALSYREAKILMENHLAPDMPKSQIANEITYLIGHKHVKPGAVIRYRRTAFVSSDETLRVTFDHDIMFLDHKTHRDTKDGAFNPVLSDSDLYLLEIKSTTNFPLWLVKALSHIPVFSRSFSKYGEAYQIYLAGGTIDAPITDQP
ncbi:MAG: polyphosphate polymerase domain-containing protein [Acholeplasmataceae bacterium]|nr:polyphosphate polymerase domain-containing protein [Acholeplasmataceae bacterium]